jgi:hypothetical protein
MTSLTLSIIIPTREGLSEEWLDILLKTEGSVEFILVHPPGMPKFNRSDARLSQINSVFRGEIIQRFTGLINASGTYVLSINCDEYIFPKLVDVIESYFSKFPDSWMLRLRGRAFAYGDREIIHTPWNSPQTIDHLKVLKLSQSFDLYDTNEYLLEVPIAPVDNPLAITSLFRGRIDHHGRHIENFDKTVWKNEPVQATLLDLSATMTWGSSIKYVPFWCLDRLLGLMLQAKFYESGKIIGHKLPLPEYLRIEDNPPNYQRVNRYYVFAELLLLKRFPDKGYFWNLVLSQIKDIPRTYLRQKRTITTLRKIFSDLRASPK